MSKSHNTKSIIKVIKKKNTVKIINQALGNTDTSLDTITTKTELKQSWQDLDVLYNEIAQAMQDVSLKVADILNKCKNENIAITNEVSIASKALYNDLNNITDDLVKIKSMHSSKKGLVKNENELSEILDIFNKYYLLFDRFKALTFQELLVITDFTMSLEQPKTTTEEVVAEPSTSTEVVQGEINV